MPQLPIVLQFGDFADRPAANTLPKGALYSAVDTGVVYQVSDTFTWDTWKPAAAGTGTVTNVATGTGLTGGPITTTGTISLANTAVTPGSYGSTTQSASITVDAQGRITAASNNTIAGGTPLFTAPQGMRLSAQNNTYIPTSDQLTVTTLYWTPKVSGGLGVVTGYNGSNLAAKTVSQKSLSLTLTVDKNYDVFYDYDGDALALSGAWTNDTTRADALADEQGATVLGSDHTKLWIGTIRASATNQTEDSAAKRFIWNAYNRAPRPLLKQESTSSWTYSTDTVYRQVRASTANQVAFIAGMAAASLLQLLAVEEGNPSTSEYNFATAISLDSTTTPHADGNRGYPTSAASGLDTTFSSAALAIPAPLGYHFAAWLEQQNDPVSTVFYGNSINDYVNPGLSGNIDA